MSQQIRYEARSFPGGWISDLSKAHSLDGFRLPRGFWTAIDERGAVETAPGHTVIFDGAEPVSSLYSATSDSGDILRLIQMGTQLFVLLGSGLPGSLIKAGMAADHRLVYTAMQEKLPNGDFDKEYILCFNTSESFKIEVEEDPIVSTLGNNFASAPAVGPPATTLVSTGANFLTENVVDGWTVINLTSGASAYITAIVDENNLEHDGLAGGSRQDWVPGDSFEITKVSKIGVARPDISPVTFSKEVVANKRNDVRGMVKYFISEIVGGSVGAGGLLEDGAEGALSAASPVFHAIIDDPTDNEDENGVRVKLDFGDSSFENNDYRIYRTYAEGSDPYFIGTISVGGGGGVFTDNLHDADLSVAPFAHGDVPPVGVTSCITYFDRIYLQVGNFLYWSDVAQPQSYFTISGGNFLQVGQADGDVGTTIMRGRNGIYFGKQAHLYKIWGRTPRNFEIDEILPSDRPTRSIGIPSPSSFTYSESGIFFYFDLAFYRLDVETDTVKRLSSDVEEDIRILVGDGDYTETGLWDINVVNDSSRGRIWIGVLDTLFFFDGPTSRFVGAHTHSYRCMMTDGFGKDAQFFLGGYNESQGPPLPNSLFTANYARAFSGKDLSFTPLPFVGTGPILRRFRWVDFYLGEPRLEPVGTDFTADLSFLVDGDAVLAVPDEIVKKASTKLRNIYRCYLGDGLWGHDLEVVFTYSEAENDGRKLIVYVVEAAYQTIRGRSGALVEAV